MASIFSMLCLSPNSQQKKCTDFDYVSANIQSETKVTLANAILSFCIHHRARPNMWPQWLFAVPLINFLKGHSQPFGQIEFDLKRIQWDDETLGSHQMQLQGYTGDIEYIHATLHNYVLCM